MAVQIFQHIKEAIGNLDPEEIRRHTRRPMRMFLYAYSDEAYREMENYLAPAKPGAEKRSALGYIIHRAEEGRLPSESHDLEIYFEDSPGSGLARTNHVFAFHPENPEQIVHDVLNYRPDLAIPLAVHIHPFRDEVSRRIVKKVARENALFALATAVPDILPFISLPWAVGEFASDTAFLTANQIRMAFLLAAASDREVGYGEQKGEIVSIMLGAFGWRALARELASKIPLGGGLIPKAAIAYAGTRVAGMSLERYYRIGYGYSPEERRLAYEQALERGKRLAASWLESFKGKPGNSRQLR